MELNEQKIKKILKEQRAEFEEHVDKTLTEQREEYQRYLGIVAEDFTDQVKLIAEQYADIKATLASHTETLASHSEVLASHSEMITSIKEDIEIMKVDTAFIKQGLKKKVDVEEFGALERRVAVLEAKGRS